MAHKEPVERTARAEPKDLKVKVFRDLRDRQVRQEALKDHKVKQALRDHKVTREGRKERAEHRAFKDRKV